MKFWMVVYMFLAACSQKSPAQDATRVANKGHSYGGRPHPKEDMLEFLSQAARKFKTEHGRYPSVAEMYGGGFFGKGGGSILYYVGPVDESPILFARLERPGRNEDDAQLLEFYDVEKNKVGEATKTHREIGLVEDAFSSMGDGNATPQQCAEQIAQMQAIVKSLKPPTAP